MEKLQEMFVGDGMRSCRNVCGGWNGEAVGMFVGDGMEKLQKCLWSEICGLGLCKNLKKKVTKYDEKQLFG